jgi:pseudouridylate synthase
LHTRHRETAVDCMTLEFDYKISLGEHVRRAFDQGAPIVALESTVIAHGLPYPLNLETAFECERIITDRNVTPATVGLVDGLPTVGLNADQIRAFASGVAPDSTKIEKVGLNNLAAVSVRKRWGATTVASSLKLAHQAGVRVFSTGGIGGVHRGADQSFDVSNDLIALGNIPLVCVCAGAKAILDLPKTVEYLETLGVPILGYQTDELPAFYSRSSGLAVDAKVETAAEVAVIADRHWSLGNRSAILLCVPVPEKEQIEASTILPIIDEVVGLAAEKGIVGKAVTPFLLSQMEKATSGRTVKANLALLKNNASVAARVAASLSKQF